MNQLKRRAASLVAWKSPEDQALSLMPLIDQGGTLQVTVENGAVTMQGRNCRFVWCGVKSKQKEGEKVLGEVEITVVLAQCQINWRFEEAS